MERLLLIGNSRWHWCAGGQFWHNSPNQGLEQFRQSPPLCWAAVGTVPIQLAPWQQLQITTEAVPLKQMAMGLGIDRALAGWGAWHRTGGAVMVVDAGTALSFTLVDSTGTFCGGRIMAGAGLQLRALHQATAALPVIELEPCLETWPRNTREALAAGVLQGLSAAVIRGYGELSGEFEQAKLWVTGGDAELILPNLLKAKINPRWAPNLALEALDQVNRLNQDH
jgi:type III pantothenate kinase